MVYNLLKSSAMALIASKTKLTQAQLPAEQTFVANPGSMSSTLSVPSLDHILQLMAPLIVNEVFQDKTFNTNIDIKNFLLSA